MSLFNTQCIVIYGVKNERWIKNLTEQTRHMLSLECTLLKKTGEFLGIPYCDINLSFDIDLNYMPEYLTAPMSTPQSIQASIALCIKK